MSKKLVITGTVVATVDKERVNIGAGSDVTEIDLPDKKYGLSEKDVKNIIESGTGHIKNESGKSTQGEKANKPG